jgi:hypothetical protein
VKIFRAFHQLADMNDKETWEKRKKCSREAKFAGCLFKMIIEENDKRAVYHWYSL